MTRAVLLDGVDVSQDTEGPEHRRRMRAAIAEADTNFVELYAKPGAIEYQTLLTSLTAATPITLTATQLASAPNTIVLLSTVLAGPGTLNVDTSAALVAALGGVAGRVARLRIINASSGAFTWTLTGNGTVTIVGTATIAQNTWRDFLIQAISGTSYIWNVGAGTY